MAGIEKMDTAIYSEDGTCVGDYTIPEEESTTHYHVVAFINGCLNDYDSGPYDTMEDAQNALTEYWADGGMQPWEPITKVSDDCYANGPYTITIEECTEDCEPDANY